LPRGAAQTLLTQTAYLAPAITEQLQAAGA